MNRIFCVVFDEIELGIFRILWTLDGLKIVNNACFIFVIVFVIFFCYWFVMYVSFVLITILIICVWMWEIRLWDWNFFIHVLKMFFLIIKHDIVFFLIIMVLYMVIFIVIFLVVDCFQFFNLLYNWDRSTCYEKIFSSWW